MRNPIVLILFLSILGLPTAARAGTWTGTQAVAIIGGELPTVDGSGARASLHLFDIPKAQFSPTVIYVGPTFTAQLGDVSLWISPQAAVFLDWFEEADAFGGSLWMVLGYESLSLFLEGDFVAGEGDAGQVVYGYYAADYNSEQPCMNFGAQAEQVNSDIDYGPHIGFTQGPFHLELQYYMDFEGDDYLHAMRGVFALSF